MEDSSSFFNYIIMEPLRIGPRIQKSDTNFSEHLNQAWSWTERQERSGNVAVAQSPPKRVGRSEVVASAYRA